jgi:hypothetical protein
MKNNNNKKVGNNNLCSTSTSCPKIGIKIHESNNDYKTNPFNSISNPKQNVNLNTTNHNSKISELCNANNFDLNIENYSMKDILHLFNIQSELLNEDVMKDAKKFVLKTHPDKSNLDPKYFLFYSSAYKKLYGVFEFQNKSSKKKIDQTDYSNDSNNKILDNVFTKNEALKDPKNFNEWFNQKFEQYKTDDLGDINKGYGDWLKSNEGVIDASNVAKADMANEFERYKKQIQSITVYNGVNDAFSSTIGTSLLSHQNNYTSNGLFNDGLGFTDLRQAYEESVIPVTEEDYQNIPKYQNINEYKNARDNDNINTGPPNKEEALKKLYAQQKLKEEESVALAFQLAKQDEKARAKNKSFWGELKQITGW